MSAFDTWFIAQHGARAKMRRTDQELADLIEAGNMARDEVERRRLWDNLRNSALYAWNIKDADKEG